MAASNGCTVSQWFDIISLKDISQQAEVQTEGLRESSMLIHQIIMQEIALIPCQNIISSWLSQGCAAALYAFLTFNDPTLEGNKIHHVIGAIVGMNGWLPFRKQIDEIMNGAKKALWRRIHSIVVKKWRS